jgi:hypothetical protein
MKDSANVCNKKSGLWVDLNFNRYFYFLSVFENMLNDQGHWSQFKIVNSFNSKKLQLQITNLY